MSYNNEVALIGYGKSNQALEGYLLSIGISSSIHTRERSLGEDYLKANEKIAFRTPAVRPDKITGSAKITSEIALATSLTNGYKIGVTGSDGKTTTSTLIHKMLLADGKSARLCGNIGTPAIVGATDTTDSSYTVLEMSSFQLFDFCPSLDCAIITGITENHLDWHTDMDEYIRAKENILVNSGRAVLLCDDLLLKMSRRHSAEFSFFSLDDFDAPRGAHKACVKDGFITLDGIRVLEIDKIRLKGKFNLLNIEGALCALYGVVDTDAIRETAYTFSGVEGRMSIIDVLGGVTVIDSSIDSTPSRTATTLSALDKSRCVVLLGGHDKGLSYDILSRALDGVKYAVICGANSDKIYRAIRGSVRAHITNNFECAVREACAMCASGDILLLSPASASFDMFENYRQRASEFARIVRGYKWKK